MAALRFESVVIAAEGIDAFKLIWRRYRVPAYGIVEIFLDINPHLRQHLRKHPHLPVGVSVLIPIDQDIIDGKPVTQPTTNMWGTI